jgi:serine/threonine protein kinase/tetratricopeptide (TPR) repeat protein
MPTLLERLRDALAPRYEIEAEVASGGMATVFRAVDQSLGRVVAVKVLRPDMATATGEARFLREARTMASFSHPNVVSIHDADQRDGLSFYVMDLVEGETLRQRLERGPLDGRDAFRLGRDLLAALDRIHAAGVIHRDVKPSNIFLVDGRALLADFGIVHVEGATDETLTSEGQGPGTPAYMSPEQAKGEAALPASDLYSLGLVLYEAMAGKRWPSLAAPESGDWSPIPVASRPVLKKALALNPAERWGSTSEFRSALRTRAPWIRVPRRVAIVAVLAIAALAWWALGSPWSPRPQSPPPPEALLDVAVFPCDATEPQDLELGARIGWRVNLNLEDLPGITKASTQGAMSHYERRGGDLSGGDWATALNSSHAVRCVIARTEDGLDVDLRLLDDSGSPVEFETFSVSGSTEEATLRQAAVEITIHVLDALAPGGVTVAEEQVDRFAGYPIEALRPFFWGDYHLRRGAWRSAAESYDESLAADPTFTLAHLRLAEVHRWIADRPIGANLDSIRKLDLSSLSPLDSLLFEASAKGHGRDQLRAYEAILERPEYSFDPYATLLYADELYHRGPLWGVPIDSAIAVFRLAVRRDSFLVPAVEHLTQALIRTGQQEEAATALTHLGLIHAPPEESDLYYPSVWGLGYLEKFEPDAAFESRTQNVADISIEMLGIYSRWARYIDKPSTQAELGALLVEAADHLGSPHYAAQGFIDRGLGLVGQGLVVEALASFDSATGRIETPETVTQAAEWSVIPYALGVDGFTPENAARGEAVLSAMWREPGVEPRLKARAATALALLADRRGNREVRDEWLGRLESLGQSAGAGEARPHRLVSAVADASRGEYRIALERTAQDLAYDSVGLADRPFLRSALYLKRGEWYEELGMPDSAVSSWLWHQNTDLEGTVPEELVQAGEVDGALGPYADGRIAAARAARAANTSTRPE